MKIPAFDYLQQYRAMESDILQAVQRVLESGQLVLGPEVEAFETEFASFVGDVAGAVGTNSGTDALAIMMRAFGIGAGDEVVTVANTAVPTVSAIREVGATPRFCDVDPNMALLDLQRVQDVVTERTRAVVAVHLYGNVVDIDRLRSVVGRGVLVLEDCAQAHGARLRGRSVGSLGDVAAFSFYPTKNLGAYGDGGLITAKDPDLLARCRSIRMYGFEERNCSEREGVNSRLDEMQAAILRVKLPSLSAQVDRRRELARRYDGSLSAAVTRLRVGDDVSPASHLYVVRVRERDRVRDELTRQGIGTGIHYPVPIHLMPGYEFLGYHRGDLPVTEELAESVLSLPMFPELRDAQVDEVCDALNRVVG